MLKSYGWWVGGLEQFSVSSRPLGFGFLGLGLRGFVPGLDNKSKTLSKLCLKTGEEKFFCNFPQRAYFFSSKETYFLISLFLCISLQI